MEPACFQATARVDHVTVAIIDHVMAAIIDHVMADIIDHVMAAIIDHVMADKADREISLPPAVRIQVQILSTDNKMSLSLNAEVNTIPIRPFRLLS